MASEFDGRPSQTNMIERIKAILLKPKDEWSRIDAEPMTPRDILLGWVVPLAAIGPVAGAIGQIVFGIPVPFVGTIRPNAAAVISTAITGYVLSILSFFVISAIINALAPSFGGVKNLTQAMKVAAFSMTASYIAGIFGIVPMLAPLAMLLGLYGFYLLYLGLPRLMRAPEDRAVVYVVATVVCVIVVSYVLAMVAFSAGAAWR
ncbi:YIP1 family protein [Sphingomonas psychrotolerans]|uniref:YIP1 family protein n=1 Tax=Sphingomonas psychrotolerans TaxID=1327635 RepID=A0ABU3N3Q2_9SPHN|nr:Yip1 family protein [Sphingomonas psychrotolerans]MDT8759093.1 YIP1 family protein [Sphingomonas psychrotolerans]